MNKYIVGELKEMVKQEKTLKSIMTQFVEKVSNKSVVFNLIPDDKGYTNVSFKVRTNGTKTDFMDNFLIVRTLMNKTVESLCELDEKDIENVVEHVSKLSTEELLQMLKQML